MINFNNEVIPKIDELLDEIKMEYTSNKRLPKYSFSDIFSIDNDSVKQNSDLKDKIKLNTKTTEDRKSNNEVSGIYVFYDENKKAVYVGISRTIIRRMRQHFVSKEHNQSSLVYLMAKEKFKKEIGYEWDKSRKEFPFNQYQPEIQQYIRDNWKVQIIHETNSYKIYLKEVYISCFERTYWNTFITH